MQDAINASAEARFRAVANRREILLGTNQYPNFTEKMGDKIEEMNPCGDSDTDTTTGVSSGISAGIPAPLKRLNRRRLADAFNELRLATERSEKQPKVFMLTIGNLAMRLARSQFSSNFFACAGTRLSITSASIAWPKVTPLRQGADVVVLCSSDDEYVQFARRRTTC